MGSVQPLYVLSLMWHCHSSSYSLRKVLNDADLEDAARAITYGALAHSGQVCMSTERIIVHKDISKALMDKVVSLTTQIKAGESAHNDPNMLSALFTEGHAEGVLSMVREATEKDGAELLFGDLHRSGAFLHPHLVKLNAIKPGIKIWERESFGPVTVFIEFETLDQAIELANDSDYSLSASLWTKNVHSAMALAPRIRAGTCLGSIYCCTWFNSPRRHPY